MKILIVDDEIDILEAILCSIAPEDLGIDQVLTATSAKRAKEIIQTDSIDILITDIEMPEENGIDLLRWVVSQGRSIVTMFCTCYSSFDYAQKAVELHAFDYYLKPISTEDFAQHLRKAIAEVRRQNQENFLGPRKQQIFWESVLMIRDLSLLTDRYLAEVGYSPADRFLLAVTYLLPEQVSDINYCKIKWLEQCRHLPIPAEFIYEITDNVICTVYRCKAGIEEDIITLLTRGADDPQHPDCPTCTYYTVANLDYRIGEIFTQMMQFARNDTMRALPVQPICEIAHSTSTLSEQQIAQLKSFLIGGDATGAEKLIDAFLSRNALSYHSLKACRLAVYHTGMLLLNECSIPVQEILNTAELDELERHAAQSIAYARNYMQKIVTVVCRAIQEQAASDNPVTAVQKYIELHLDENLSRNSLAERVYLNADYFARLFRKQAGISLGAYILNQRIKKAKILLKTTNKSVTEIAGLVGYDNSSYFTQVFQHKTGLTPLDYRNT